MRYLLSYDISKGSKRYQVVKILEEFGCWRIQKSIYYFEGNNFSLESLRQKLKGYFRKESLIIIPIEDKMIKNIIYLGIRVDDKNLKELIFI